MSLISAEDRALFSNVLPENADSAKKAAFFEEIESYITNFLALNEEINLTSIREPRMVFWKHFYDSLLPIQYLPLGDLVDWGSGGGFPAVPIAFYRKHFCDAANMVTLLDSRAKKLSAISKLALPYKLNLSYAHSRGEEYHPSKSVCGVTFRAVAPPEKCLSWLTNEYPKWFFYISPDQVTAWNSIFTAKFSKKFNFKSISLPELPFELGPRALIEIIPTKLR
mgnify:CR=1 FL=1